VHLGEAVHKGAAYPGEHDAIITRRSGTRCTLSCRSAHGCGSTGRGTQPLRCCAG
jgi:hypothetical protein